MRLFRGLVTIQLRRIKQNICWWNELTFEMWDSFQFLAFTVKYFLYICSDHLKNEAEYNCDWCLFTRKKVCNCIFIDLLKTSQILQNDQKSLLKKKQITFIYISKKILNLHKWIVWFGNDLLFYGYMLQSVIVKPEVKSQKLTTGFPLKSRCPTTSKKSFKEAR